MAITVSVSNLGPLRAASVELRPLVLLIGANNTGKTYFATVIQRVLEAPALGLRTAYSTALRRRALQEMPRGVEALLRYEMGPIGAGAQTKLLEEEDFDFDDESIEWARKAISDSLMAFAQNLQQGLQYAFGVTVDQLYRRTPSGRRAHGGCHLCVQNANPRWRVDIDLASDEISIEQPDALDWLRRLRSHVVGVVGQREVRHRSVIMERFMYSATPLWGLFDDWPSNSVHLPAGRTGIMQSYQVLASSVVRQSAVAGIRPIEVPTLPGTAADFLSLLLTFSERQTRSASRAGRSDIDRAVADFESDISVGVRADSEFQEDRVVVVTPEGTFPLSRTSSMVSELAPILLTARYVLNKGDELIVDEPEAHLHPAMQTKIARFFASLSNQGVRLVLTTHSDFFLSELNNLIRSKAIGPRGGVQLPLVGERVDPGDVFVLRFDRTSHGCVASELPVDPVEGIDQSLFADVVGNLYEESLLVDEALRRRTRRESAQPA